MKKYQRLPDSELDIMLVLWHGHAEMNRLEIEQVINEKKQLASTTILSLLSRLEKKGYVKIEKKGQINLYTALVSQEEYQHAESRNMLEKLYENSLTNFVASLYQGKKIDKDKIEELNVFLQELKSEEE